MNVSVSKVANLDSLFGRGTNVQTGEYILHHDWPTWAVVTGVNDGMYLLSIVVPKNTVISVTYDRKRQYGLNYRIRATAAKILSISDASNETLLNDVLINGQQLESGRVYDFDLCNNTFFVLPNYTAAKKFVAFVDRYM